MTTANSILAVARKEIGNTEWPPSSNKQKYGKAYGWNGTFWCAQFVWWCGWIASGKDQSKNPIAKNASAAYIHEETVKRGGKWIMKQTKSAAPRKELLKKLKPGDLVSFDFGAMDGIRDHVEIVDHVEGNYIVCIGGNTSVSGSQSNGGMVCKQKRSYNSICCASRPKYTKDSTNEEKPVETTLNASCEVGKTYVIATKKDPLNIRKGAGKNMGILGSIPKGKKVKCLDVRNGWLKVKYGNVTGWICGDYVKEA